MYVGRGLAPAVGGRLRIVQSETIGET